MNYPKLSIIVPTYNRAHYLEECLDSIISQEYPNIEIIITDDNSIDNTEEICKKYLEKYSYVKYVKNLKYLQGPTGNKNNGIDNVTGEYIAIFDDDDYFIYNKALKFLMDEIVEKDLDAVMAGYKRSDNGKNTVIGLNKPQLINYGDYLCGKIKGDVFTISKKYLWDKIRYNDKLYGGEGTTNFKVLKNAKIFHTLKTAALYRVHPDNVCFKALSVPWQTLLNYEYRIKETYDYMKTNCPKELALYYKQAAYFAKLSFQYKKGFKYIFKSLSLCFRIDTVIMLFVMFLPKRLVPILSKVRVKIKEIFE